MKNRNKKITAILSALCLSLSLASISSTVYAANKPKLGVELSENSQLTSNLLDPHFTVTNNTDHDVNLKDVNIRYFYNADSDDKEVFTCIYAGTTDGEYETLTPYVTGEIKHIIMPSKAADTYLQLGFTDGVLKAGQSMTMNFFVNKTNWASFDKSNDFSYNNIKNVQVILNGFTISGVVPPEVDYNPDPDYVE